MHQRKQMNTVKESLDLTFEGQAQLEIMKRDVRKRGGDPALVRGTGVWKQNLNLKLRSNLNNTKYFLTEAVKSILLTE